MQLRTIQTAYEMQGGNVDTGNKMHVLRAPAILAHYRKRDQSSLTTTHQIFSEERTLEPEGEHVKIRSEAGKQLCEV
jgi:hypothetical protein